MLTNQAIVALAGSAEEKQVGLEEVVDFEADMSLSWVVLPSAADKTKPGRCMVLRAYWPNPEFDEFIEAQLEQMLETLKLSIARA